MVPARSSHKASSPHSPCEAAATGGGPGTLQSAGTQALAGSTGPSSSGPRSALKSSLISRLLNLHCDLHLWLVAGDRGFAL